MRTLIAGAVLLLLSCGTEVVELAPVDSGGAQDVGPTDNGLVTPPADSGMDTGVREDLGAVDTGAPSDSGASDAEPTDDGVMTSACQCWLPCRSDRECEVVGPSSTCSVGLCTTPPGGAGCTTDADCTGASLCRTVADPQVGCR